MKLLRNLFQRNLSKFRFFTLQESSLYETLSCKVKNALRANDAQLAEMKYIATQSVYTPFRSVLSACRWHAAPRAEFAQEAQTFLPKKHGLYLNKYKKSGKNEKKGVDDIKN